MGKENICGIYCIENLANGKKYIGLSRNMEERWKSHIFHLNGNYHINDHLQSAWNKYKEENFKFSILEECDENTVNEREMYFIEFYNSQNRKYGYNKTSGGEGTLNKSDEILEKMSQNITKQSVIQFDLDGNYIAKFRNCAKAANSIKCRTENIRSCCNRAYGYKTQLGFVWMYEDDYLNNGIDLNDYIQDKGGKSVSQYDLQNNFITTYESAREAERQTGIGYKMISRVCNGGRPHTHGYIFKFA